MGEWNINYYTEKLKEGNEYENFVVNILKKHDIKLTLTTTFEDQINIGETLEGYEIKFDDKLKETGNLYIETEERTNKEKQYVPSGIFRDDNTIKYVIGNYDIIFIFNKTILKDLYKIKKILENHRETSKGFLLSRSEGFGYCDTVIEINVNNKKMDEWM